MSILKRFFIPDWVREHELEGKGFPVFSNIRLDAIRSGLRQLHTENPLASIILPAYNEERYILQTLSSLSKLTPLFPTELIVANNNSTDKTQYLLDRLEIRSIFVKKQGVSYARQAALEAARGKFILCADADTIYPPDWGNAMAKALETDPDTACVYGKYSFLSDGKNYRWALALHEFGTDIVREIRRNNKPFYNVMGCNCAFRREQALAIGGFDHARFHQNANRGEDGFMALHLSRHFGHIRYVPSAHRAWTSDRKLTEGGNLPQAMMKRVKRYLLHDFNPFVKREEEVFTASPGFFHPGEIQILNPSDVGQKI